jgi:3-phenylpropionate/cinnamic acid dioxygenase small subunit
MLAEVKKPPAPAGMSALEVHYAVTQLNNEAAAALDNEKYDEFPPLFVEDAVYRVVPRENYVLGLPVAAIHCESRAMIEDRLFAARESTMSEPRTTRHIVSNVRILEANDQEIRAESNVLIVETLSHRMTQILLSGVYIDRIVRSGGRLLFKERLCVYDSLLIPNSLVAPV